MSSVERIGISILGCGRMAARHARVLDRLGHVSLSFASRSRSRAVALASRHPGSAVFDSYADAVAWPGTQVVLIATPPDSHRRLAEAALASGRHVVVEKPAFLTSADVDVAAAAAATAGRQVLVAENYHYKPLVATLRRLLEDEVVGQLRLIQINAAKWQASPEWLGRGALEDAGALFEGGVHWIHLLAGLGPDVVTVHGFRSGPHHGVERSMTVVAEYRGGATGVLFHSWDVRSPLRGLRMSHMYGTEGTIGFESNGLFVRVSGRRSRLLFPGFRDLAGYRAMWTDFLASIRGGGSPRMTLALARRDLELIERAYRGVAIDTGREV